MVNGYTHTECYYTARQIWTEDVWKSAILRTDVLSDQISSVCPYPKKAEITPKPHFGGPFNEKPIIEIALRKSQFNGATKLKLYSYIVVVVVAVVVVVVYLYSASRSASNASKSYKTAFSL